MGHNIDLTFFGLMEPKCSVCSVVLDISEVDIDCDLTTHNPNTFELSLQCPNCEKDNEIKYEIKKVKE